MFLDLSLYKSLNSYPFVIPRLYNYIRLLILPLHKIAQKVPETGNILDVGCGYGLLDIYLAKTSRLRNIIGSELNEKRVKFASVAAAKINLSNVSFVSRDLVQSENEHKFDCIIMVDLLHHISLVKQKQLLNSAYFLLKKGGKLIIKDLDNRPAFKFYWNLIHDKLMTGFDQLYFRNSQEIAVDIEQQGFTLEHQDISNFFYAHHIFICEKK